MLKCFSTVQVVYTKFTSLHVPTIFIPEYNYVLTLLDFYEGERII
jgi:hypothetical protein